LLISNRKSFRVLFDKITSVYFIWKKYIYILAFQMDSPAGNQLYRHTFVPIRKMPPRCGLKIIWPLALCRWTSSLPQLVSPFACQPNHISWPEYSEEQDGTPETEQNAEHCCCSVLSLLCDTPCSSTPAKSHASRVRLTHFGWVSRSHSAQWKSHAFSCSTKNNILA